MYVAPVMMLKRNMHGPVAITIKSNHTVMALFIRFLVELDSFVIIGFADV